MFNNQMINITTAKEDDATEEHSLSNERKEQTFLTDLSPLNDNRLFLRRSYTSPRLFKSLRNRGFLCYRMSRSLSFDNNKNDRLFKSPNSSSGSSNVDNEKHLTRSAKIMRALNFNCGPFYSQRKKIKKTLNFNLSPSPKKFSSNVKSSRDNMNFNLTTSSPKINKTLNFDTSPSNSSTSSILLTSFDSTDENQNQTPSQRNNKKAKKLLDYITPKKRMYVSSQNMDISSPSLRLSLKEKIDDIVQMNCSPSHSFNQNRKALNFNTRCNISTPRNLYADFSNEDDERPHTPENTIPIIPESMSAIKKSHKKERSLRQMDNLSIKHANVLDKLTDPFMVVEQFDDLRREKRPLSPPMVEQNIVSVCDTNSIEQSHKKDKSRKKMSMLLSGDELSDSGSIFEYSIGQGNINRENNTCHTEINLNKSDDIIDYDSNSNNISANSIGCCELINSSNETINNQSLDIITGIDTTKSSSSVEEEVCSTISQNPLPSTSNDANKINRSVTPLTCETNSVSSVRVITPENQIDFLQHIQTESIKKSHKKIKEEKRKKLFLPRNLEHKLKEAKLDTVKNKHFEVSKDDQDDDDDHNDNNIPTNEEDCVNLDIIVRASTPENVNSSRLLLSNFTSVKKSHKKDKHNKIVSQFIRRQQLLNKDADYNNVQHDMLHNDVTKMDQRKIKNKFHENDGAMSNLHIDNIKLDFKVSPSKRKILSCLPNDDDDDNDNDDNDDDNNDDDDLLHLPCNSKLTLSEGRNMEEFKISTPIKKRRALLQTDVKSDCLHKVQSNTNDSFEEEIVNIDASRCLTPIQRYLGCTVLSRQNTDLLKTINDDKNSSNGKSNSIEEEQQQQQPDTQDQNGRSTPQNMSTIELLPNINSIKKSHKKDKRGNGLHRSLILEQEKLFLKNNDYNYLQNDHRNSTIISKSNDNKSSLIDNTCLTNMLNEGSNNYAQNSTVTIYKDSPTNSQNVNVNNDRENILTNDTTSSSNKTPPNCLMVKNYMRLLQTTSIKKSHKKERDRKKHKIINKDPELSDEGSIFGDSEKVDTTLDDLHIEINSNKTDIDRSDYV